MRLARRSLAVLSLALLVTVAPAFAAVVPLAGATPQRAVALTRFANSPAVRVVDGAGAPVAGAEVVLTTNNPMAPVGSRGCNLDFMIVWVCVTQSDAQGVASFPQLQGLYAGSYQAEVRARLGTTQLGSAT